MNRIKALRKEKGFAQVKIQMMTGIDQSDYSKFESGKRYFTFEQCRKLAIALNTSMDYLAGLTDEKKPSPRSTEIPPSKPAGSRRAVFVLRFQFIVLLEMNLSHRGSATATIQRNDKLIYQKRANFGLYCR